MSTATYGRSGCATHLPSRVKPDTGRIFINDVGQNTWEEIADSGAGSDYGCLTTEGVTSGPAYLKPLYVYNHSSGTPTGCAITGGTFCNPTITQFPALYVGKYCLADCLQRQDAATTT